MGSGKGSVGRSWLLFTGCEHQHSSHRRRITRGAFQGFTPTLLEERLPAAPIHLWRSPRRRFRAQTWRYALWDATTASWACGRPSAWAFACACRAVRRAQTRTRAGCGRARGAGRAGSTCWPTGTPASPCAGRGGAGKRRRRAARRPSLPSTNRGRRRRGRPRRRDGPRTSRAAQLPSRRVRAGRLRICCVERAGVAGRTAKKKAANIAHTRSISPTASRRERRTGGAVLVGAIVLLRANIEQRRNGGVLVR